MAKRTKANIYNRFSYKTEIVPVRKDVARLLRDEYVPEVTEAHWEIDGTWYKKPDNYPCVLFDLYGFYVYMFF
jgi:hypothetical protein